MKVELVPGLASVRPEDAQQYLTLHGWTLLGAPRGDLATYESPGPTGSRRRIRVPCTPGFVDYPLAIAQLVEVVASVEARNFFEILNDLLSPLGDLLRFRVFSPSTHSGAISVDDSIRMRIAQRQLLLASAHSVLQPMRHHARLSQAQAVELLRTCRETQTQRGSYVMTVVVPVVPRLAQADEPFGRQTTRLLMTALAEAHRCVTTNRFELLLEGAAQGLSSNFLAALAELRPEGERSHLEVNATWVSGREKPFPEIPLRFGEAVFAYFAEAARGMKEREPGIGTEIQGYVVRLARAEPRTDEGEVVIAAPLEAFGGTARVHARLPGPAYAAAVSAHGEGRRVSVLGTLRKDGRRFILEEPSGFQVLPERGDDEAEAQPPETPPVGRKLDLD